MPQFISKFVFCPEINNTASQTGELTASDEESDLNSHLQKQLEEDVARIFDESIYSDLEVVCGKLKILTHTCILKTRTSKFFHELENILHVNIGPKTFDEIYSFVSDAYTECNIEHQEHEIIKYLNETLKQLSPVVNKASKTKEDVFETLIDCSDCTVNQCTSSNYTRAKGASPSTELTKEYYALVPINESLLEKELIEQDKLSNGFLSIKKTQADDKITPTLSQPKKPTTLSLYENNSTEIDRQFDDLSNCSQNNSSSHIEDSNDTLPKVSSQKSKFKHSSLFSNTKDHPLRTNEPGADIVLDSACSPDSLITDEPSSSSDYLSATFTCSPGTSVSSYYYNLNPSNNFAKMEPNNFTITDSGIENTGMITSNNSHVDVTLPDLSVSESHLHSINSEGAGNSHNSQALITESMFCPSTSVGFMKDCKGTNFPSINKPQMSANSTNKKTQRQNEDNLALESYSLSSQTGSLESVFPPKFAEKHRLSGADSLVVEEIKEVKPRLKEITGAIPIPNQPSQCSAHYNRHSYDLSEVNDNEDTMALTEEFFLDGSPLSIFNMTFEKSPKSSDDNEDIAVSYNTDIATYNSKTPSNSILSVKEKYLPTKSQDDLEIKTEKYDDYKPDVLEALSIGSQMEWHDHQCRHSSCKQDINDITIESQIHKPEVDDKQTNSKTEQRKSNSGSFWIDMSKNTKTSKHLKDIPNASQKIYPDNSNSDLGIYSNERNSLSESNVSEKSGHTYFIDLADLPEPTSSAQNNELERHNEKDNMFSMYIEIGENSKVKEKPPKLPSNNSRTSSSSESKLINKNHSTLTKATVSNSQVVKKPCDAINSLMVFEKIESLCNDPNIHINEIIKHPNSLKNTKKKGPAVELPETIKPEPENTGNAFVKLSDLDKSVASSSDLEHVELRPDANMTLYEDKVWDARMTRSIPGSNWIDPSYTRNAMSVSFNSENALSLNRIFPNLIKKFSTSVPASLSICTRLPAKIDISTRTGEVVKQASSDLSEPSSLHTSVHQSTMDNITTEEYSETSSVACNNQSRLGQDLLRMFLEEIATDVMVEVNGRRIKAHKCILASRCQFFAASLSGGYIENSGDVIVLPPFSYNVTHFVMCHIYAGISAIPDSLSIVELATLADMLNLEGLKEAIMFSLKTKYCHHFHKPCSLCIAGVIECFPLSSLYGLDDLYLKCLKWITKHYVRVWPTKMFATLPTALLEKCFYQQTVNFSTDSLVETVIGYGIVVANLQNNRWAQYLMWMCHRLIHAAARYAAPNLVALFHVMVYMPSNALTPAKDALDECFTAAIELAPPEEACRAYDFLSKNFKEIKCQSTPKLDATIPANRRFIGPNNLLSFYAASWRLQCEGAIVSAAPSVTGTKAFLDLPCDLRKRLRDLGCILFVSQAIPQINISQYDNRREQNKYATTGSSNSRSLDIDRVRAAFVPYSTIPIIPSRLPNAVNVPLNRNDNKHTKVTARTVQPPKVRMTRAQEQRTKYNMSKHSQDPKPAKQISLPYWNSTNPQSSTIKNDEQRKYSRNRFCGKNMSSSESSCNSSPSQIRRYRSGLAKKSYQNREMKAQTISQDSLLTSSSRPHTAEPSTDSLSESHSNNYKNKYATYTKAKRGPPQGSVETLQTAMKYHHGVASDVAHEGSGRSKVSTRVSVNYQSRENKNTIPKKRVSNPSNVGAASRGPVESNVNTSGRNPNTHGRNTNIPGRYANTSGRNASTPGKSANTAGYNANVPSRNASKITSGSLMNATKSSSAKIVSKAVKATTKPANFNKTSGQGSSPRDGQSVLIPMNRSGTFLMSEPSSH